MDRFLSQTSGNLRAAEPHAQNQSRVNHLAARQCNTVDTGARRPICTAALRTGPMPSPCPFVGHPWCVSSKTTQKQCAIAACVSCTKGCQGPSSTAPRHRPHNQFGSGTPITRRKSPLPSQPSFTGFDHRVPPRSMCCIPPNATFIQQLISCSSATCCTSCCAGEPCLVT